MNMERSWSGVSLGLPVDVCHGRPYMRSGSTRARQCRQAGRQGLSRRQSGWPAVAGCAHHFHGGLLRWGWCGAADAEGRELLRHGLHAGLSLLLLRLLRRGGLRRGETHPP